MNFATLKGLVGPFLSSASVNPTPASTSTGAAGGVEETLVSHVISAVVGNATLSGINTAAHTAIRAAVTEIDGGIDHLREVFEKWDAANPLVETASKMLVSLVEGQGLELPSQDDVVTHLKAAVAEVAASFGVTIPTATSAGVAAAAPAA